MGRTAPSSLMRVSCASSDDEGALPSEVATTTTLPAPSTTVPLAVPVEVVDGAFLGVGYGSPLPEAQAALPQLGAPVQDGDLPFGARSNSTFCHYWLTELGALALVWEGETMDEAHVTNWQYAGSRVDGVPLMVGRAGVTVGSDRSSVLAAYAVQPADDLGDLVMVDGSRMRFGLEGDTVTSMGLIDCGD